MNQWLKKAVRVLAVVIFLAICAVAFQVGDFTIADNEIVRWYSVVPPLLAVALVMVTHRLIASLIIAVIVGGILSQGMTAGWAHSIGYVQGTLSDEWNLQILLFVPFIMAMIAVMVVSGGFSRVVLIMARFCRGRRSTQFSTFLAGLALFFDDYANTMVVGSGMRPLADRHKMSRSKLAFLVDATSAPIAGVALISTWIGYEIGLFRDVSTSLALGRDGYSMFLDALGFRFYCLMMIIFVIMNALSGRDFSTMLDAEHLRLHGKPRDEARGAGMVELEPCTAARPSILAVALPMTALFAVMIGGFWYDGGGFAMFHENPLSFLTLSAWQKVLIACENSITILTAAAIVGMLVASLVALAIARTRLLSVGKAVVAGVKTSLLPMLILVLAWTLKAVCDDLGTGKYLIAALGSSVSTFTFPTIIFVTAGLTAFSTGTSWGTMAILIPTAVPLAHSLDGGGYGLMTMMCLGAVLDGAIFGDHCSPISDTTIMSSTASNCDHLEHVHTQLPYALLVGIVAIFTGYLPATLGLPFWASLLTATVVLFFVLMFFGVDPTVKGQKSQAARLAGFTVSKLPRVFKGKGGDQLQPSKDQPQT